MQRTEDKITMTINVRPEEAWRVISKGDGVDKWFSSLISSCRVDGDKRYCQTTSGVKLIENILEVNHEKRSFRFGIPHQDLLPASNIIEVMSVKGTQDGKAEITWSGAFDADPADATQVKDALKSMWTQGLREMEAFIMTSTHVKA